MPAVLPSMSHPGNRDVSLGFGNLSITVSAPVMRCGVFNRPDVRRVCLLIEVDTAPPVMKPEMVSSTTLSSAQHGLQNNTAVSPLKKIFQCGQAKLEPSPVNKVLKFTLGLVKVSSD